MRVRFAFLADYALTHPIDTKLYILGAGFDTIWAPSFPARHPQVSVVVRVEFAPMECGRQHVIEFNPLDTDGRPFLPPATVQVTPQQNPQAPRLPAAVALVVNLAPLELPRAGDYAFSIVVDGQELDSIPLHAIQLGAGQPPPPFLPPQLPQP